MVVGGWVVRKFLVPKLKEIKKKINRIAFLFVFEENTSDSSRRPHFCLKVGQ